MIPVDLYWYCGFPVKIVNANLLAVSVAPKNHELLREFWAFWIFEKVNPPPPMPCVIVKHVFRVDVPYIAKDFVHELSRIR